MPPKYPLKAESAETSAHDSKFIYYTFLSKKPLYKKPVHFAEKVASKIRNFLGFTQIFKKLFREILCNFDLF